MTEVFTAMRNRLVVDMLATLARANRQEPQGTHVGRNR